MIRNLFVRSISTRMPFYAVASGRVPGIYKTWDECKLQIHQFSNPVFKKFSSPQEAQQFIKNFHSGVNAKNKVSWSTVSKADKEHNTNTTLSKKLETVEKILISKKKKSAANICGTDNDLSSTPPKKRKKLEFISEPSVSSASIVSKKASESIVSKKASESIVSKKASESIVSKKASESGEFNELIMDLDSIDWEDESWDSPKVNTVTNDKPSTISKGSKTKPRNKSIGLSNSTKFTEQSGEDIAKLTSMRFDLIDEDFVKVYTDGACSKNGARNATAGIGVWFGHDHPLNVSEPVIGRPTNNKAEIDAVRLAAIQAKKAGVKKLKIFTDSQFVINCCTKWMKNWKRNGWKTAAGKPVINREELIELENALCPLIVTWQYVAGHKGILGNEMADKLARDGCLRYKAANKSGPGA